MTISKIKNLEDFYQDSSYELGQTVNLDYSTAIIASNDFYIQESGGLPLRTLLIAAPEADDSQRLKELMLLKVKNIHSLEHNRSLVHLREDIAIKKAKINDPTTQNSLQTVGYECEILGTFYKNENGVIQFGSDITTTRAGLSFVVYKPYGKALSNIVSFSNDHNSFKERFSLGTVRYSDTRQVVDSEAEVFINIKDIIAAKTGVLGATRAGKSNTIKILTKRIFDYTHSGNNTPVGQIIFDPQGEYANVNSQDGNSALAEIADDEFVRIYRMIKEENKDSKERHLQFNFLDEDNIGLAWELMLSEIRNGSSAEAHYLQSLFTISFEKPDQSSSKNDFATFLRKKLAFYALLEKVRWSSYSIKPFNVYVGERTAAEVTKTFSEIEGTEKSDTVQIDSTKSALDLFNFLLNKKNDLPDFWQSEFEHGALGLIEELFTAMEDGRNAILGALNKVKLLHSEYAHGDVREKIWNDLSKGRLVIVDLSRGSSLITTTLSEMIVNYLLAESSQQFISGINPNPYQIIVEEAHNLFRREGKSSDSYNPWVRLSKEAAKYNIGLVYATQEVSSVDNEILSNTKNFFIGHLNSRKETNELANYYNFKEWSEHIIKAETRGFIRMKTASSPFIIPVQVDKFEAQKTEETILDTVKEIIDYDSIDELF